jgi:hypothetical protein
MHGGRLVVPCGAPFAVQIGPAGVGAQVTAECSICRNGNMLQVSTIYIYIYISNPKYKKCVLLCEVNEYRRHITWK